MEEINKQLLSACRKTIEDDLNWGTGSTWTNDDFDKLSDGIWEKTKVRLSRSTLKRVWGKVRYDNFPNGATLNALAAFAGYDSWRGFCQTHPIKSDQIISVNQGLPPTRPSATYRWLFWAFVTLVIILLVGGKWLSKKNKVVANTYTTADFVFNSRKVTEDLPNSVVFNYNAGAAPDANVIIQQSWDPARREKVDANGKQHTSIYYYPGYFLAKLLVNGQIVKETPVFIKTNGWKGLALRNPVPFYFNEKEIGHDGAMGILPDQLAKALHTDEFNGHWIHLANIREYPGIDPNNFVLETSLKNASTATESYCRNVNIEVLGSNGVIIIPLATTGCIADLDLFTGDAYIQGKDHDLSALGCDFRSFQELKCIVSDHIMQLYLNNKLAIKVPQKKSLGRIVGIRFLFEGAGLVKSTKLYTPNGTSYVLID